MKKNLKVIKKEKEYEEVCKKACKIETSIEKLQSFYYKKLDPLQKTLEKLQEKAEKLEEELYKEK